MPLIKLKQIENGAAITTALTQAHEPMVALSTAAPFSFNPALQQVNIPLHPTLTTTPTSATFTPGDGSPPVTFTPSFPADAFLTAGAYNSGTQTLDFTLSNGNTVVVPVSSLAGVVPANSTSITLTGDGTLVQPLTATAVIAPTVGNQLSATATGLFVPATPLFSASSETVEFSGDGTVATPFSATVKLQPDNGALTRNFLHATAGQENDNFAQLGLGYTEGTYQSVFGGGLGPFDLTTTLAQYANTWNGAEIVKVQGFINGVFYVTGWNLTTLSAVTWNGIAGGETFDLAGTDDITFIVSIRAT